MNNEHGKTWAQIEANIEHLHKSGALVDELVGESSPPPEAIDPVIAGLVGKIRQLPEPVRVDPNATPEQRRKQITDIIEQAQRLLGRAAELACPLANYCDQWEDIGRGYDHVEALWWRIHEGPLPGNPVHL